MIMYFTYLLVCEYVLGRILKSKVGENHKAADLLPWYLCYVGR